MKLAINKQHARVRAARARRWFDGNRVWVWRIVTLGFLLLAGYELISGNYSLGLIFISIFLFMSQFLAWDRMELRRLPASELIERATALETVGSAQLLQALSRSTSYKTLWAELRSAWEFKFIMNRLLIDPVEVGERLSGLDETHDLNWLTTSAINLSAELKNSQVGIGAITAIIIMATDKNDSWLSRFRLNSDDVIEALNWQIRADKIITNFQNKRSFGGVGRDWAAGYTPLLNRYAVNISAEIEQGFHKHILLQTHTDILDQIQVSLAASSGSTVALIGDTGSGKTAIIYALANRLLNFETKQLRYHKIFVLDSTLLVSEAKRTGNIENLLLHILSEARAAGNIIIAFDDAQSFFTDGAGAIDISNVLRQIIQSNSLRMIFSMKPSDWQQLAVRNNDITAQTQQLIIPPLPRQLVEKVAQDQMLMLEGDKVVTTSILAIREAYRLADRYLSDQAFPGKIISLLQTSMNYAQHGLIVPETVQLAVENSTGVKLVSVSSDEADNLLNMEDKIHQRMINQTYAVKVVSDALRRSRSGVRDQSRPVGSFLFLGPTGVGKTELAKSLAAVYFGGEKQIIRLDMSEYAQTDSATRLIAPAGLPGNFLTQLKQSPFSVVLLDEIEKSSPQVLNLLLQILDEGQLTDVDGKTVSFRDAIVICTSNAGADIIRAKIQNGKNLADFSDEFIDKLIDSNQFKPELINRFDEVVLFRPLTENELVAVVDLILKTINNSLADQKINVTLSSEAIKAVVKQGYDPRLGARPIRRVMQRSVENVVARKLLEHEVASGETIHLDLDDLEIS